ncbi:alpha/beta hydrolase [Larkinella terrae]|nr:alpha/beta hydrolase-fold protein [Larkinella terrae]
MKKRFQGLLWAGLSLTIVCGPVRSQSVTVDSIYSSILKRKVATTIILPPNYTATKSYPVFYLLHRWAGNHASFLKTNLLTELKDRQLLVVTPSADTSWYVNAVGNATSRYEDFMVQELFPYIDKKYGANPTRQAIGGYSMGGYGALQLGLKHLERFRFIGDISGPINAPFYDVPPTPRSPLPIIMNSVRVAFGDQNSSVARESNVFNLLQSNPVSPRLFVYMAVGKQDEFDFMIPQHQLLIEALKKKQVPFAYQEYEANHFSGKVVDACLPDLLTQLTINLK